MIVIDPTERAHLPHAFTLAVAAKCELGEIVFLPGLESATGADMVLSIWDAPASTKTLRWEHVKRGVGIQLKRGTDLVSSVYDGRLINQLTRMLEWWDEPWLVHFCDVTFDGKDAALFDDAAFTYSERPPFTYRAYTSAKRNWQRAGGYFIAIDPQYPFDRWVSEELERMRNDKDERLVGKGRQTHKVEDGRKKQVRLIPLTPEEETLASYPGIGPVKAHALWLALKKAGARQSLIQAEVWLTDGYCEQFVEGYGSKTTASARKHKGLQKGERLEIGVYPEVKEE